MWVVEDDLRGLLILGIERYSWGKTKPALDTASEDLNAGPSSVVSMNLTFPLL